MHPSQAAPVSVQLGGTKLTGCFLLFAIKLIAAYRKLYADPSFFRIQLVIRSRCII
jgi:hypothetical protein